MTEGIVAVLAVRSEEERHAFSDLLTELGMVIHHAHTGREAIILMEDHDCDFLLMDIQLPDMHAWALLGTLRESVDLGTTPIVVISDETVVTSLYNVTTVTRPISMARLRAVIAGLFENRKAAE